MRRRAVGQFRELVEAAEKDRPLCETLKKVLKLTKARPTLIPAPLDDLAAAAPARARARRPPAEQPPERASVAAQGPPRPGACQAGRRRERFLVLIARGRLVRVHLWWRAPSRDASGN